MSADSSDSTSITTYDATAGTIKSATTDIQPATASLTEWNCCDLFNRLCGFGSLLIVDLRPVDSYSAAHIPRAINLPLQPDELNIPSTDNYSAQLNDLITRISMTDRRGFNLRQRQSVLLYHETSTEPQHVAQLNWLYQLLTLENRVASVQILSGGVREFLSDYPFLTCSNAGNALRHTHLAPFPWFPSEIVEKFIYLGNHVDAANQVQLKKLGITHILNVSSEVENEHPNHFKYIRFILNDEEDVQISDRFHEAFAYFDEIKASNGRILVHCHQGVSRSATIVLAYLMHSKKFSLKQSYDFVKNRRKQIMPNIGFWYQLEKFEKYCYDENNKLPAEEQKAALSEFVSTLEQCVSMKDLIEERRQKQLKNQMEAEKAAQAKTQETNEEEEEADGVDDVESSNSNANSTSIQTEGSDEAEAEEEEEEATSVVRNSLSERNSDPNSQIVHETNEQLENLSLSENSSETTATTAAP